MEHSEVVSSLLKFAKDGNLNKCEEWIKKYRIPWASGKDAYKLLRYHYDSRGSKPTAGYCNELFRNKTEYEKKLLGKNANLTLTGSGTEQVEQGTLKLNEIKYKPYWKLMNPILELEKKAQEDEFKETINKDFDWLSQNNYALISITGIRLHPYDEDIFEQDIKKWKVVFNLDKSHLETIESLKFKIGSTVYIFIDPINAEYTHEIFAKSLTLKRGTIHSIDEKSISIIIYDDVKKWLVDRTNAKPFGRIKDKKFSVVRGMNETTYKIQSEVLQEFAKGNLVNQNISDIIVNEFKPGKTESKNIQTFFLNLNDYQKECVNKSFENNDVFLIHGPPGTGKTKVCSEIVAQQLIIKPESKIMVCADSNQAVDNILENVAHILPPEFHIKLLRIGTPDKIKETITKFLLKNQKRNHPLNFYIDQLTNENIGLRIQRLDANEIKKVAALVKRLKMPATPAGRGSIRDALVKHLKMPTTLSVRAALMKNRATHNRTLGAILNYSIKTVREQARFNDLVKTLDEQTQQKCRHFLNRQMSGRVVDAIDTSLELETFIQFSRNEAEMRRDLKLEISNLVTEIYRLRSRELLAANLEKEYDDLIRQYRVLFDYRRIITENKMKIKELKKQIYYEILLSASIIFCTNTVAGKKLITETLKAKRFDLVIIDEATQGTEFSTLIPLMKAEKLILAGDSYQLPPTIVLKNMKSSDKTEQKIINESIKTLETTLFEKLIRQFEQNSPDSMYKLRIQYRMDDSIIGFINKCFYNNELISDESCSTRKPEKPLVLINTETPDSKLSGSSSINDGEADIVYRLISEFKRQGYYNLREIGVITPYAAQVALLDKKLKEFGIKAKTVDGFQGQEKDIIIVSLVRSDPYKYKVKSKYQLEDLRSTIGFLSDMRRLNVTITRFRKKLILIGNTETLSRFEQDPENPYSKILYKDLFEYIRTNERGLFIKSDSELDKFVNTATILDLCQQNVKLPNIFSNECSDLRAAIINSIKIKYTFELLAKKSEKNKNLFLQKYYSGKVDYGSRVKIDIRDSIEDNLTNEAGAWHHGDEKEHRRKVLDESIKENGKAVVAGVLDLALNLTPLDIPHIKNSLKEDREWIADSKKLPPAVKQIVEKEKTMNNPTASGGVSIAGPGGESPPQAGGVLTQRVITIDSEKVEKHSKMIEQQLTQIVTLPYEIEANFLKIQNLIFEHLDRDCLIVDKQIRLSGLRNLVRHLRLSKTLSEADLLTTKEVLRDVELDKDDPTRHYKQVVKDYSKELKYPLVVKFVSNTKDSFGLHDRFIHSGYKTWTLGPALNILHDKEGTVSLVISKDDAKRLKERHLALFIEGKD